MNQSNQQIDNWPWKHIRRTNIPHKVAHFVWILAKEIVFTQDNLMRRKNTMCSRCFLSGVKAETVNHLFLHCRVTEQIWRTFITPGKITEALQSWEAAVTLAKNRNRRGMVPACI